MTYTFRDVELRGVQPLRSAVTKISGVGLKRADYLCDVIGIAFGCRVDQLNSYFFFLVVFLIKQYYGTDLFLKRMRENRLNNFLSFKSYRSIKYAAGLPIRGQHTHTNAKTAKGLKFAGRRSK